MRTAEEILHGLNDRQREAVTTIDGPLLILAGAGSGKTRVLTHRAAYLVAAGGIAPWHIMAVTFTNKAAAEMARRIEGLLGYNPGVWVSTFHSAAVRILREDGGKLGLKRHFLIFDTPDQIAVVKDCLHELNLDPRNFDPRAVLETIGQAKNELVAPGAFLEAATDFWHQQVGRVYRLYQEKLAANQALDFDDLIMATVRLWQENADILDRYQERFRYIMVDEYQDTNHAQYVLVRTLASKYRNLCVVGDDNQSIYGWRGADIRNILDFERDYPDCRVVKLEQNYRSTATILQAANHVIKHNISQKEKNLWTDKGTGEPIGLYEAADERDEARFVAQEIYRQVQAGKRRWNDFALLYRTNAQSRSFEEAFMASGIPYRVVGTLRFYERREIKDILAYLRAIFNPADRVSLMRIMNVPKRGIGEASQAKLVEWADREGISLFEALARAPESGVIPKKAGEALRQLAAQFDRWREEAESGIDLVRFVQHVLEESGYTAELRAQRTAEAAGRLENLNEFINLVAEFQGSETNAPLALGDFLERVALISDADTYREKEAAVTLMTLHAAKGLEFEVVFLVGLAEGVFPHARVLFEPEELEEERRLLYVGITRAKSALFLSYPRVRSVYGRPEAAEASRFLEEVPPSLVVDLRRRSSVRTSPAATTSAPAPAPAAGGGAEPWAAFQVGDVVRHRVFGEGRIVSIKGEGAMATISVAFAGAGIKNLLAEYAPLERVGS